MLKNDAYRYPWTKGCNPFNADELLSEVKQSICELTSNALSDQRQQCLLFNGIEHYIVDNSIEEIVPNSDPTSNCGDEIVHCDVDNSNKPDHQPDKSHLEMFPYSPL
uniref:Uncharacterized protein n=1 Tax=Ciona savignyi TaxID=51511 RepID=H2YAC1_CIOSA